MEDVYAKLYHKYTALKKRCLTELDDVNREQEVKFLEYISVAEEAIQYLKDENARLRAIANNLRDEVSSIRGVKDKQYEQYEKLVMEEKQKNKMLQEEVKGFQNRLHEVLSCSSEDRKNEMIQLNMVETEQVTPRSTRRMTRKRSREAGARLEEETAHGSTGEVGYDAMVRGSIKRSSKGNDFSGDLSSDAQPECCKRTVYTSGGGGSANCRFQALFENLVGMKLSTVNQTDGICISALHQSSGYSFTLTWVKKGAEEEPELLYRVLTLGTFERIAPEWMRSVLMFSMRMFPIFFERVACVIKLRS